MQRILSTELPAHVGADRHHRRLGPPPPAAQVGRVPDRAGRRRAGPGRRHRPGLRAQLEALPEETVVEVTGTVVANAGGARRGRADRRRRYACSAAGRSRRRSTCTGPTLTRDACRRSSTTPRWRCGTRRRPAALRIVGGRGRPGSGPTLDARRLRRDPHAEDRRLGDRVRGERVRARLLRPARRTWPSRRSSTSRRWSASSSGSTRSGRCSGPSRTTPPGTWPQYTSLDAELGFIADHRDVMAVLRDVAGRDAGRRVGRGGAGRRRCPKVPAEIPAVHFAEALRDRRGDPADEPDLAPAHERALGEWALREHGSDFVFVTGYPMAQAAVLHPPGPGATRLLATASTCCSAGWSWSPAGSGCTGTPTTWRRWPRGASRSSRTQAYLDAFRHGMPPHGGFAIGLERFVARLTGAANVREVTAVPARPAPPDPVTPPIGVAAPTTRQDCGAQDRRGSDR